ncbi:hypothetical protein LAZ67_X002014, partial [Cordylochernes scorpioides]
MRTWNKVGIINQRKAAVEQLKSPSRHNFNKPAEIVIFEQYLVEIDLLKEDVESQLSTGDLHVLNQTKENLHTSKLNHDSQVLKLAKYKSLDIADKFRITYNVVKKIDGMLVSINILIDGIKQDKSTSEECSIKLPKFQLPIFSGNFSEWLGFKEILIKRLGVARSLANLRLRETSKTSPKLNKVYSHATSVSRPNSNAACTPCMLCKNPHLLSKCQLFQNKSPQERWRFVRDNGLCYNCLRSNHLVYACKLTAVYRVCKLRHHTLLHTFNSESQDSNSLPGAIHAVESSNANRVDSSVRSNVNSSAHLNSVIQTHSINHSSSSSQILLSTALIRVNDLYGNSCMARALVDTGSQRTLITDSLRKTFNLPVNYSDASMYGIGDNCLEKPLGEVDITFSPHYSNMLFTAKALISNKITFNLPNFLMEGSRWPHLVGLRLADPTFDKPAPIDIIIGADIAPSLYRGQVRFQNERGPTACNSKLGWLLSGKIMAQQSDGSLRHSVLTFCATSIDIQLRKFWELDSIPPCTQPILTKEEIDDLFGALSADIEKMYRQILIHPDDSDYQRVLWRDLPSDAIQEYKLTTITYGTACAPYLAIRTLHQLSDDEAMNYPVASEIVKRDFYVDDLLTGADIVEEAQVLIRQIFALLAEGGFPIRKWVSNSPKILDFLPKDQKGINQSFDFKDLRVSAIQRKTPSHSWFHVPDSENPADLATRGSTPAQLVDNQLWWQGPHWLQDPSVNSYIDLPPSDELSPETLIEERSTILVYQSIVGPMPKLLLKYSSWIKTVDVMAFCLRFILNSIPDEVVDNSSHISRWKCIQSMKKFLEKWSQDYLNLLQARPRWHKTHQDLQSGQLVLMKLDSIPPHHWPLALIIKTYRGPDGH